MTGKEEIIFEEDGIYIRTYSGSKYGNPIMHNGEKNLMELLASIATKNGGDILEIGFGIHLSADAIQSNPNVTSHTIIEVHPEIYKKALEWAKGKANVEIILGDWTDIIPNLDKKFDGILHDTHIDKNIPKFLDTVKNNCNENCIVSFFEYLEPDPRLGCVWYSFPQEERESLPYDLLLRPPHYRWPLKYTVYSNGEFINKNIFGEPQ
jgi:cyclopropane fatty-acyl-phospholipid synthase-like methyltransferase